MRAPYALLLITAGACAACSTLTGKLPAAKAVLEGRSGSNAAGSARLSGTKADGVHLHIELHGLAANSVHGFHIHDKGDCSAADAASAGGHFNPTGTVHGSPERVVHHAGDLPALTADAAGNVRADFDLRDVTLGPGPNSIAGRSLIVHRDPDDYLTQPAGNSGPRIACGVIAAG